MSITIEMATAITQVADTNWTPPTAAQIEEWIKPELQRQQSVDSEDTTMADFVHIISDLSNFVQNERTASYNEGVDMILENARTWMATRGIDADAGEHIGICDLLNRIEEYYKRS